MEGPQVTDGDTHERVARWMRRAIDAEHERDRLQATVEGLPMLVERTVRALQQTVGRDLAADPDTIRDAVAAALAAVRGGEVTGG